MRATIVLEETKPGEFAKNSDQELIDYFTEDPSMLFEHDPSWDIRRARRKP